MMPPDPPSERFDCVDYMRNVRDRISAEIATMDHGELMRWLRAYRYSDPALRRIADRPRPRERQDGEDVRVPDDG